ncbi:electron transfer flavoprotein subunit beta/FixA family protein [Leucobacter sp. HY1910]
MKLIVLVKEVPDTFGDRKLDLETGLADRAASEKVLDEISERALEVALRYADEHPGTEITALALAPADATTTVRKALAMGADRAIHVVDDELSGADITLTAETLAAAIRREEFDVVIAGSASTDGASGMLPSALAEYLGVACLSGLSAVEVDEDSVRGTRIVDTGVQQVSAALPAVITITEALPDPRFPNFKGIMAAKKKPLDVVGLGDLQVEALRPDAARSIMLNIAERPPRSAGIKISDEGNAGSQLAQYLIENRLV